MAQINFGLKEISCKVVYYGPGMSGKTTNLEKVFEKAPDSMKGKMTSIATEGDRTLFFDFLPLELGQVAGMKTKFQLYTVPGQVYYDATRKLVLKGADGVIFVADSNPKKKAENIESLKNLEVNLKENGFNLSAMPFVLQYNKRDLPTVMTMDEMHTDLNWYKVPVYEAVANKGEGVMQTLKELSRLVLKNLNDQYGGGKTATAAMPAASPAAASQQPVAAAPAKPAAPSGAIPAPTGAIPAPSGAITPPKPVMPAAATVAKPTPQGIPTGVVSPKPAPVAQTQQPKPQPVAAQMQTPKEEPKKKGFFSRLFGG